MKIGFSLVLLLIIAAFSGLTAFGQCDPKAVLNDPQRTTSPTSPIDGEQLMAYIDYALIAAQKCESNLIAIVKMEKNTSLSLAKLRMKRVGGYIRFRGFRDFAVAANFDADETGRIELFVAGKLLYTLPLKKKDELLLG